MAGDITHSTYSEVGSIRSIDMYILSAEDIVIMPRFNRNGCDGP